jgi:tetratricopeptide (TPR) repeat protein
MVRKLLYKIIFILLLTALNVGAQAPLSAEEQQLIKLNNDTLTAYTAGHYDDALTLGQQTLTLSIKLDGEESKTAADAYFNLGEIYSATREYLKATENLQHSLTIYQKKVATDKAKTLKILNELGRVNFANKDLTASEKWFKDALVAGVELYGKDSVQTIDLLMNLSILYHEMNDDDKAETYFWSALQVVKKTYSTASPTYDEYDKLYQTFVASIKDGKIRERINDKHQVERLAMFDPGQIINGKAKSLKRPVRPPGYPRQSGRVVVKVTVNINGKVVKAEAFSGPQNLFNPSIIAALKSEFFPTLVNGQPVRVVGYIVYNFN